MSYRAYCLKDKTEMEWDHYEEPKADFWVLRACYYCEDCGATVNAPVRKWREAKE